MRTPCRMSSWQMAGTPCLGVRSEDAYLNLCHQAGHLPVMIGGRSLFALNGKVACNTVH
ncbi:hypothetical protein NA56DRAFT_650640 [Hyaloscypha hepaticicola]|uniref:Uncharacterized protein n=1 Tax=Hyaloscypha hepaticicola TaxID=2082293 RepID=A0A2J6PLC8_9HELO|nr:hypothetical protein NA56DRAFT_650640 [Hyaloscypha hepaticicola]